MNARPKTAISVRLTGTNGNVFAIIGTVARALRRGGQPDLATEYTQRCFQAGSYDEVLRITLRYVDVS